MYFSGFYKYLTQKFSSAHISVGQTVPAAHHTATKSKIRFITAGKSGQVQIGMQSPGFIDRSGGKRPIPAMEELIHYPVFPDLICKEFLE
jgi:hypothetical protein